VPAPPQTHTDPSQSLINDLNDAMAALTQVAQKIADWDPNSHACIPESEFEPARSAAVKIKEYLSALIKTAGWNETLGVWAYRAIAAFDSLYTIVARASSLRGARVYRPEVFDKCDYSEILRCLISSFDNDDDEAAAKVREKKVAQYSFTRLPYYLPTESLLLLARAAGADLYCAAEQLFSSAGSYALALLAYLRPRILSLEGHLENVVGTELTMTFEADFERLRGFTNDYDFLTLDGLIAQLDAHNSTADDALKVPWWDGSDRYPAFQVDPVQGCIRPHISALVHQRLQKEIFFGWHLAIWAQNCFGGTDYSGDFNGLFQTELGPIGLWPLDVHESTLVDTITSADDAGRIDRVTLPHTLFRVTGSDYSQPYYFSTGPGRYDPVDGETNPPLGAIYLARTSLGCWAEVFDRMPTVLLSDLQSKSLYAIDLVDPDNTKIADLTVYGDRLVNAQRDTSQKIAGRLSHDWGGIEYSLRSMVSHTGVALFGPASGLDGDGKLIAHRADGSTRRLHSEPDENWPIGFEACPPLLENWRQMSERGESLRDPDLWKLLLQRRSLGAGQVLLLRWLPEAIAPASNSEENTDNATAPS